jgi:hypothetical protein
MSIQADIENLLAKVAEATIPELIGLIKGVVDHIDARSKGLIATSAEVAAVDAIVDEAEKKKFP